MFKFRFVPMLFASMLLTLSCKKSCNTITMDQRCRSGTQGSSKLSSCDKIKSDCNSKIHLHCQRVHNSSFSKDFRSCVEQEKKRCNSGPCGWESCVSFCAFKTKPKPTSFTQLYNVNKRLQMCHEWPHRALSSSEYIPKPWEQCVFGWHDKNNKPIDSPNTCLSLRKRCVFDAHTKCRLKIKNWTNSKIYTTKLMPCYEKAKKECYEGPLCKWEDCVAYCKTGKERPRNTNKFCHGKKLDRKNPQSNSPGTSTSTLSRTQEGWLYEIADAIKCHNKGHFGYNSQRKICKKSGCPTKALSDCVALCVTNVLAGKASGQKAGGMNFTEGKNGKRGSPLSKSNLSFKEADCIKLCKSIATKGVRKYGSNTAKKWPQFACRNNKPGKKPGEYICEGHPPPKYTGNCP